MIDLTSRRDPAAARTFRIIGLGGAGANMLDRMALDGVLPEHLLAVNTDAQALSASVAGGKIQLGREATRGLGTGGDPELGRAAAQEAAGELGSLLEGVDGVFLLAGLGGGTGSGAAPVVAEEARRQGALVIAFVTLPFGFEGKRRGGQAEAALAELGQWADAIVCFENDRMADNVSPTAGIAQAFAMVDQTVSAAVRAVAGLLARKGLIHLGFADLRAALQGGAGRCLFGHGEAEGGNRPFDALAAALRSPLMDKGRLLRECGTVLVSVSGGADLTLNEVQLLMEELNRLIPDRTRLLFGACIDPALSGRLAVTLLTSLEGAAPARVPVRKVAEPARAPEPHAPPEPEPAFAFTEDAVETEEAPAAEGAEGFEAQASEPPESAALTALQAPAPEEAEETPHPQAAGEPELFGEPSPEPAPESAAISEEAPVSPVAPRVTRPVPGRTLRPAAAAPSPVQPPARPEPPVAPAAPAAAPVAASLEFGEEEEETAEGAASRAPQQETLRFEPVTRGRFEKSEPTIVDGEDLDVPTFLRRNLRIRS